MSYRELRRAWAVLAVLLAPLVCCAKISTTPIDSGLVEAGVGVATDACTLLVGLTTSSNVETICATVEEVMQVVALILTLRQEDAGAPKGPAESCQPVGSICATKREIGRGIEFMVRARAARLSRDAGKASP